MQMKKIVDSNDSKESSIARIIQGMSIPLLKELQQHVNHCLERKGKLNSTAQVSLDGERILESTHGYADQPKFRSLTRESQFLAGSLSKQFIAVALVTAIHDQVINEEKSHTVLKKAIQDKLQQPLSAYISSKDSIWAGEEMPFWANKVTLHQLLTHTSGLKDFIDKEKETFSLLQTPACDLSTFVSLFKNEPLYKGNSFHYANSNYLLAGYVAATILNDALLENYFFDLFKKLGMHGTAFTNKRVCDLRKDPFYAKLTFSHEVILDPKSSEPQTKYLDFEKNCLPWASGSLVTTGDDLLKWTNEIFIKNQHIPPVVSEIIQTKGSFVKFDPQSDTNVYYCYGIEYREDKSGQNIFYEHGGKIFGFFAYVSYFPGEKICTVELANMVPSSKEAWKKLGGFTCEFTPIIHRLKTLKSSTVSSRESGYSFSKISQTFFVGKFWSFITDCCPTFNSKSSSITSHDSKADEAENDYLSKKNN